MKDVHILQKIAETGNCELVVRDACLHCPLAKLKKRPDGSGWLSCFESIVGASLDNVTEKYKEAARAKLAEIAIEDAIAEIEDHEKTEQQ